MTTLPTPRALLSSLLPPLSRSSPLPSSPTSTPTLPPTSKPLILTLHCLFPNELLPALDLLDRRLITRFVFPAQPTHLPGPGHSEPTSEPSVLELETTSPSHHPIEFPEGSKQLHRSVYYVRSSAQPRTRFPSKRASDPLSEGKSYEVRLQAWNCSCAAFAFAAFSGEWDAIGETFAGESGSESVIEVEGVRQGEEGREGGQGEREWRVGGVSLGEDVLVCKHLLACVLAERVEGLAAFVDERMVGREEVAGWAAGWGG